VELVEADAAVIRTYDRRRDSFVPRAVYVAEEGLTSVVGTMLSRPHSLDTAAGRALYESPRPTLLSAGLARDLGVAYELLAPFLERGATAAVVPVASAGELIATLTLVSLDSERPIGQQALDTAASLATHAALAVDNARLYEQQRHFLEAMQKALLPQSLPEVPGLELAQAYESSARLEVGGDVYDFLVLADGRLAVVLGDVTGHGVDAAADMAMAKYIFRSLAREHTDPADFLASANDVVVGEIALGKLITMVYLAVDGRSGELRCAAAGHPPPRLVRAGGVHELAAGGVALGIDAGQRYDEVSVQLAPGDAVVLYTDGVIEARCGQELYGVARLDAVLAANAGASAEELAAAVLVDCRAYAGGELADDCALVVVKRV
jgi:serine phosphatase RsbU (regulator of sigma subunit)